MKTHMVLKIDQSFNFVNLENPVRVLTLNEEGKLEWQNIWRVPIILNSKYKTLFTVIKVNNHFEIIDVGGVQLAKELQKYTDGNNLVLLRLYKYHMDFVSNSNANLNSMLFRPLESANIFLRKAQNNKNKEVYTMDEIKLLLK